LRCTYKVGVRPPTLKSGGQTPRPLKLRLLQTVREPWQSTRCQVIVKTRLPSDIVEPTTNVVNGNVIRVTTSVYRTAAYINGDMQQAESPKCRSLTNSLNPQCVVRTYHLPVIGTGSSTSVQIR